MEILSRCGAPLSMDLPGLNVPRDRDNMTAQLAAGLVATLFGKRLM
jgi:arginase family enzyme